ncbi:MAG: mechanosensitive ion channel family protein, partial [Oscillospiraceae bacterium]|nr:mechanosensitive ion channel family protein [Oscillospiraceae bacterium]
PFRVGDYIETCGLSGTVEGITVFYTVLLTPDNKRITLPNGTLTNSPILNYSDQEDRRVDLEFSVAYNSDIEQVDEILKQVAEKHEKVKKNPAPFARLLRQDPSALVFVLRAWCESDDYWTVYFDLNEAGKKALDANGIAIPFPQLDVHLDQKN